MTRPLLLAVGLLVMAAPAPRAEEKTEDRPSEAAVTIRQIDDKRFPEIAVEFEVKAPDGQPILDASRDEFRVYEDDRPVSLTGFQSPISREFRPTTVVLVLDRSSSMNKRDRQKESRIAGLKRAVEAFLDNQPKGSRVAVVAFSSEVDLVCPFTDDPEKVREAVGGMIADGQTAYYDAVLAAIRLLSKESGRRAILAMTDGDDNFSEADLPDVIRAAQKAGLPIHTLSLGSREETRPEELRDLAEKTRGQAFTSRDTEGLRSIFEEIARNLGHTYTLSYRTDRPIQDGTLRPIKIYYARSTRAAESAVYIPGMVVPAAGWSWLFLGIVGGLAVLSALPNLLRR